MLRMAQINHIKDLYENEDLSLREIARKTGHSFKTVQKYAYQLNWSEDNLPDTEPKSYPVLGNFIPVIDKWLEADRKIPRKQRHTIWRIFCRLRDEYSFGGSYSSVKKYVRKKRFVMHTQSGGYLPLKHVPGSGQVDFGKHLYYDGSGKEQEGYALTLSFPNSNKGYTQTFPSQNQECLLEGMRRIFGAHRRRAAQTALRQYVHCRCTGAQRYGTGSNRGFHPVYAALPVSGRVL